MKKTLKTLESSLEDLHQNQLQNHQYTSSVYLETSSLNLSKLSFCDCAFVTDLFIDFDVEEKHVNLNDVARYYNVNVSMYDESRKND